MTRILTLIAAAAMVISAHAELDLKPVHPDEPAEYTFNQRFSVENALRTVDFMSSALESFRKLTEQSKSKIPKEQMKKIGNTDWDIQNLGFRNAAGAVKGVLLKQQYQIKKLTYDLALQKSTAKGIDAEELAQAKAEYQRAEKTFQEFWNSFGVSD